MNASLPDRWLLVKQHFPDLRLADVRGEADRQMAASGFADRLPAGARVAIGVGSRGIANLATIVRGVVDYWRARGMRPFIVPAMGSHGAATAEGQTDVLARFGITEASMGCPIVSCLDVVSVGSTSDDVEVFMDAAAYGADAVMLVGRVKWHTNFNGRVESGLFKMMAIGLGKFAGAQRYHAHAKRLGLEHVVLTVGRRVLATGRILGGLAILEDAHHHTAKLDAVPADRMEAREAENLALVKSWMATLPCDLDVLIVDEMGKDISGTGMDAKVVNRGTASEYNPWPGLPRVGRIFVRALSEATAGSAVGIGMADVTTDRLVRQVDWAPTIVNALASSSPSRVRLPMHFATDRECLERIAPTTGRVNPADVTYGWIRNTLELARLVVSSNLRTTLAAVERVTIADELERSWDSDGNLRPVFDTAMSV